MPPDARGQRHILKFALPPSLGRARTDATAAFEAHLGERLGRRLEVLIGDSYEMMAKDLLAGRVDAAWAPPYVCARVESMGARILVRGVRHGASTYRSALVCHEERPVTIEGLAGKRAAWVDQDSVGGYLLAVAHLRAQRVDPHKTFFSQEFFGSYRAAVEAVASGRADLTCVFAPSARAGAADVTGLEEIAPELASRFKVVAFTEDSPNDGVAVTMEADPQSLLDLERTLLTLGDTPDGAKILKELFHADGFEPAPRLAYRALYRVALATL